MTLGEIKAILAEHKYQTTAFTPRPFSIWVMPLIPCDILAWPDQVTVTLLAYESELPSLTTEEVKKRLHSIISSSTNTI